MLPNILLNIYLLQSTSNAAQVLFSDIVLIAEGQTERRVVPELFAKHFGASLQSARIGLVTPGGSGDVPKCLKILDYMGIHPKALVDLDFAFRVAVQADILDEQDADLATFREVAARLADAGKIEVDDAGYPRKGRSLSAEDAARIVASEEDATAAIQSLHGRLRSLNIWLWTRGAIENHIGITSKSDRVVTGFLSRLQDEELDVVVADAAGIKEFLSWMREPLPRV